uniref:Uncharacterized protein n=1 Tax=Rhodnius prolixus TaxID=13249 RepID=T1I0H7_RHOPR
MCPNRTGIMSMPPLPLYTIARKEAARLVDARRKRYRRHKKGMAGKTRKELQQQNMAPTNSNGFFAQLRSWFFAGFSSSSEPTLELPCIHHAHQAVVVAARAKQKSFRTDLSLPTRYIF